MDCIACNGLGIRTTNCLVCGGTGQRPDQPPVKLEGVLTENNRLRAENERLREVERTFERLDAETIVVDGHYYRRMTDAEHAAYVWGQPQDA